MKFRYFLSMKMLFLLLLSSPLQAEIFRVSTLQEFDNAHDAAAMNDSILWASGIYPDIFLEISKSNLFIAAETLGGTVFNGASRVDIRADNITLQGFQFVGGDIGDDNVIETRGNYTHFNEINIRAYTSYKYLLIRAESQYGRVTYCNFENRLNLDDQNILSILANADNPGYHKVQYCSFKNFAGTGNDLGIEPIRIGVSTQADFNSRSLVEYCYFTHCDGDGELISSKASQNVYRFNTFENNPKAELVLRHGSEAIVYGNFFLNGKGGVRVREGQDHYIYNNYFYEIDDRAIYLQNEDSDPLDNINIAFNTIVDCSEVLLGRDGDDQPTNVTFANNIFADPDDVLFEEATGNETWIGNISDGALGINPPASGITMVNAELVQNSSGFYGLAATSPAVDAAVAGYANLPQFEGMDPIDTDILFDLMQQERPTAIAEKDLGCNEYPHDVMIQPIATEENTGPSYNSSIVNSLAPNKLIVDDLIEVFPNPLTEQIFITLHNTDAAKVRIEILDLQGKVIDTIYQGPVIPGTDSISKSVDFLSPGNYLVVASSEEGPTKPKKIQTISVVKL